MKKIIFVAFVVSFSLMILTVNSNNLAAGPGLCYLCGSGSSCQQCPSQSGKDTWKDQKACEKKGCRVTGTSSCSTAVNVKKC
jgi:hypothetical protein